MTNLIGLTLVILSITTETNQWYGSPEGITNNWETMQQGRLGYAEIVDVLHIGTIVPTNKPGLYRLTESAGTDSGLATTITWTNIPAQNVTNELFTIRKTR